MLLIALMKLVALTVARQHHWSWCRTSAIRRAFSLKRENV